MREVKKGEKVVLSEKQTKSLLSYLYDTYHKFIKVMLHDEQPVVKDTQSLSLPEKAIKIINESKYRSLDTEGRPGGLIEFNENIRPVIIGDLHGAFENLSGIVEKNKDDLDQGRAYILILGDLVHDDEVGFLREMGPSLKVIDYVFNLIIKYPERIFILRGNHDTFDENLVRHGINQGAELLCHILEKRGIEFAKNVEIFFDSLPVFFIGGEFVAAHAGPVRGGITRDQLVNIRKYKTKYRELIWNRVNEFVGSIPNNKEYGESDIRATLKKINRSVQTTFIVGHNPRWVSEDDSGVWLNILGIKNHHVVYSSKRTNAAYLTIEEGGFVVRFGR